MFAIRFAATVVEALRGLDGRAAEDALRRQVDDVNRRASWARFAKEWAAWLNT